MVTTLVIQLDDSVRESLRAHAEAHGVTLEDEVRSVVEAAASRPVATIEESEYGWGTKFHNMFEGVWLTDEEYEIINNSPTTRAFAEPATFDE